MSRESSHSRFGCIPRTELGQLLALEANLEGISPFIPLIFPQLGSFQLSGNNLTAVVSKSGKETLQLREPLELQGNPENWIDDVADAIQMTIKYLTQQAIDSRGAKERFEWISSFPCQTCVLVERIRWTTRVTQAIEQGSLPRLLEELRQENMELIIWMRGDHDAGVTATVKNLIIYGINQASVVERLISSNVTSTSDFAWRNQLKAYQESSGSKWVYFTIRDMRQYYGYNYSGNDPVLVITELTEATYAYMFEAMDSGKRYASIGPPGTGKTETVRNLSIDLGLEYMIINGSKQPSAEELSGYIKDSANSGIWLILDDGQLLQPEEVSKLANQLREEPDCRLFVTADPGSPQRKQWPPEFQGQLHEIKMTLPERSLIYEVQLSMAGWTQAKNLAFKLSYFCNYAENVFSKQRHYDYGLRFTLHLIRKAAPALKATIASGTEITPEVEQSLFYKLLVDPLEGRLTAEDSAKCEKIRKEIFYGYEIAAKESSQEEKALEEALGKLNLDKNQTIKMNCLFRNSQTRHGNAVLGPDAMSGTKALVNATMAAMETIGSPAIKIEIDADAATIEELYGPSGLITSAIESSSGSDALTWIVIQGGNDAEKSEYMNTVLDDNKTQCLANGNKIPLGANTKIVYLWDSVSNLGPAAISRVDVVYLNPEEANFN